VLSNAGGCVLIDSVHSGNQSKVMALANSIICDFKTLFWYCRQRYSNVSDQIHSVSCTPGLEICRMVNTVVGFYF